MLTFVERARPRTLRRAEQRVEEVAHCRERATLGSFVVRHPRDAQVAGPRVREAVPGAAVHEQVPVDARLGELLFEAGDFLGGNERIRGSVAGEHLALDVAGTRGAIAAKNAVKADDSRHVSAAPRELQHAQASEAEADRAEP